MEKDQTITALRNGICNVIFTKKNGDKRAMRCTLEASLLPTMPVVDENNPKPVRKSNPDVVAVYDLEAQGWRSFRWDSIVSFSNGA
jgi:hypothetical protein|tara:strand:- start:13492 stop:13749 length:258 start_codon:yes stop_codon:yes gene_type:complete